MALRTARRLATGMLAQRTCLAAHVQTFTVAYTWRAAHAGQLHHRQGRLLRESLELELANLEPSLARSVPCVGARVEAIIAVSLFDGRGKCGTQLGTCKDMPGPSVFTPSSLSSTGPRKTRTGLPLSLLSRSAALY